MSDLKYWSSDANNNNASSPDGISANEPIKNIDNWGREVMAASKRAYLDREWIDNNHIPTYVSSNSFTVETDLTAIYTINRRVRLIDSVGNKIYGTITASSYSDPNTTITLVLDSTQLNANINQVAYGSFTGLSISKEVIAGLSPTNVPIGSIFSIASTNIPSGFIECNGARLLISAYQNLADLLYVGDASNTDESKIFGYKTDQAGIRTISGTYITIPDLRGEFIRGFDNGRGVDTLTDEEGNVTNRAFGSFQEDEFKSHTHASYGRRWNLHYSDDINLHSAATNFGDNTERLTKPTGGSETRPRNIALTTIIKY